MTTAATEHELFAMLRGLAGEVEGRIATVRVALDDGTTIDVFRAQPLRERPIVWRIRGFVGDDAPRELTALVLGTLDGRAMLTMPGPDATSPAGHAVVSAEPATRRIADLADLIARRVRERFGDA